VERSVEEPGRPCGEEAQAANGRREDITGAAALWGVMRDGVVEVANAEDSDFQHVRARPPYASSSMRSMARLALRAISSGTRTWGDIVSSDWMTLSSVIVFMKAQTAFAFTG
jgi:hypothetical protein